MKKNLLALALALAACLGLTVPASAAGGGPLSAEEGTKYIELSADLGGLSLEDVTMRRPWTMQYLENEEEEEDGWVQEERAAYGAVRRDTQFTVRHTGPADDGTTLSIYAACYLNTSGKEPLYSWLDWPGTACLTKSGAFAASGGDLEKYGGPVALRAGESVTFTLPFDWYAKRGWDVTVELRAVMDFPQYDWTYWKTACFRVDESAYVAASIKGPSTKEPPAFSDVKESDWFRTYVEKAVDAGLMSGTSGGVFSPNRELSVAEALALAYQLHSKASGAALPQAEGPWYMPHYQYCLENGIVDAGQVGESDLSRKASRFDIVSILDGAVPASRLEPVKTEVAIPDLAEADPYGGVVYKWYRAGIVSGDQTGRFNGGGSISRAEVAVILCRLSGL